MPTQFQVKQIEKALREYRKKYLTNKKNLEVDESATRLMVNHFLTQVLGYAEISEIRTEYNIRGEYADYVIQLARKKHIVIEVKSIQIDLNDRHLRQSLSYAANEGIDWIMLFNGRQIQLYRVIFGKPISHHQVFDYDLVDLSVLRRAATEIANISKKAVVKGDLEIYWKRFDALMPRNLASVLSAGEVIRSIRLKIKKNTGINFDQGDILLALNRLVSKECPEAVNQKIKN